MNDGDVRPPPLQRRPAVPCSSGAFLAWITPHALAGEADHGRADAVRMIAEGEPDFDRL